MNQEPTDGAGARAFWAEEWWSQGGLAQMNLAANGRRYTSKPSRQVL